MARVTNLSKEVLKLYDEVSNPIETTVQGLPALHEQVSLQVPDVLAVLIYFLLLTRREILFLPTLSFIRKVDYLGIRHDELSDFASILTFEEVILGLPARAG